MNHFIQHPVESPIITALLPDKRAATCNFLFQFLRNQLLQTFGSIGAIDGGYIHFDFECASKNACSRIFPEATAKGCLFHYSQAVQRNIQMKGLQKVYEQTAPYDTPQFTSFRTWVRRLVALPLLCPDLVRPFWDNFLSVNPVTGDGRVDANIQSFSDYFDRTWLHTQDMIEFANHHNHDVRGPQIMQKAITASFTGTSRRICLP